MLINKKSSHRRIIATVLTVGIGTAKVQLPSGEVRQVRGDVSQGDRVFIENGNVISTAPNANSVGTISL